MNSVPQTPQAGNSTPVPLSPLLLIAAPVAADCKPFRAFCPLLDRIIAENLALWEQVAGELNGQADRDQRRMIHMGCLLQTTYGDDPRFRNDPRLKQADQAKATATALSEILRGYRFTGGRRAEEQQVAA